MRILALIGAAVCVLAPLAGAAGGGSRWALAFTRVDASDRPIGLDIWASWQPTARPLTRPRGRASDDHPTVSSDGRFVAFVRSLAATGLYVVATDGGTPTRLSDLVPDSVTWSPDGGRLAFTTSCDPDARGPARCVPGVYVVDRKGHITTALSRRRVHWVTWSPDGRTLLTGDAHSLLLVDLARRNVRPLAKADQGTLGEASWSPNGRLIAYGRRCREVPPLPDVFCDVATMRPDGSSERTLVTYRGAHGLWLGQAPLWFPDGALLVPEIGFDAAFASVAPDTGKKRAIVADAGAAVVTGSGTSFAYVGQERQTNRATLVLADREGGVSRRLRIAHAPTSVYDSDFGLRLTGA